MRVALLQTKLDAKSRAANIQGLIAAIHRAADTDPAPDLLVLPGGCDTGGAAADRGLSEPVSQTVRETIAFKAREWGVYIAAGFHVQRDDVWVPSAVLFDPDADVVAIGVQQTDNDAESAPPALFWSCALGRIGVFEPSASSLPPDVDSLGTEGAFIALPTGLAMTTKRRRAGKENVASLRDDSSVRGGAYWGVVSPAGAQKGSPDMNGPATFVCAPKGKLLAAADTVEETIVFADVPLDPVLPRAWTGRVNCDGQAD